MNVEKTILTKLISYVVVELLQKLADRTDNDIDDAIVTNVKKILSLGDMNGR